MLSRTSSRSLTEQLAERFAERIRARLLSAGTRLPSVRECARQQGVSPHTVVAAYDLLLAQGLVEAHRQRGFFVRDSVSNHAPRHEHQPQPAITNVANGDQRANLSPPLPAGSLIHATALIRGMFHQPSGRPQPGSGVLPPEWLDLPALPAAVRKVINTSDWAESALRYGEPMGDSGLRTVLAHKLADMGMACSEAQIITTAGATHALDIVSRTLLKAGDPVMVEEPGWSVEFARLAALGMRVLPVPRRADGPDLEVMARYCESHAPRLFVSVSVFHNPTGFCLPAGSAHRLLQLAERHDFHVMEDDTYGHLAPEHATRVCALDSLQRTVYVGGFAKVVAPNWRVGFLAAPLALIERLLDTKLITTLTTASLLEKAMAICIEQGQLRRHVARLRARLDAARTRSVALALAAGCRFANAPAGPFGWVDTGVDTDLLAQRMLDDGYLLAPGALFHATREPSTLMRINFATTQDAAFWKAFEVARDAMR